MDNRDSHMPDTPPPLVLDTLRNHFRSTYLLNGDQVETMLVSSSKSLKQALTSAGEILEGKEPETGFALVFHGLKGLLLNMGEHEWAKYTKELEETLKEGGQLDFAEAIYTIEKGLAEILNYGAEKAP